MIKGLPDEEIGKIKDGGFSLKYCQRCGKFYRPEYRRGFFVFFTVTDVIDEHVELDEVGICPECRAEFVDWMAEGMMREKEE